MKGNSQNQELSFRIKLVNHRKLIWLSFTPDIEPVAILVSMLTVVPPFSPSGSLALPATMALIPRKKRCKDVAVTSVYDGSLDGNSTVGKKVKFGDVGVFLVERRMGSSRRRFLTELAWKKGFRVEEQMR